MILLGDNRKTLATLPAGSVHLCVTSPPYYGLRSYLPAGHPDKPLEIGSEQSPAEFIDVMVQVFREVRRVLRDDGTLWVNLGDSYNQYNANRGDSGSTLEGTRNRAAPAAVRGLPADMSAGQLMNMPHRVAEALRADGWIWRQTIVWRKASPMPESIQGTKWVRCQVRTWPDAGTGKDPELRRDRQLSRKFGKPTVTPCPGCKKCLPNGGYVLRRGSGRCTTAHEYIFVFAKQAGYYWNMEAVKEEAIGGSPGNKSHRGKEAYTNGDEKHRTKVGLTEMVASEQRIPRSVQTFSTEPLKLKHFAAYPSALPAFAIKAGTARECCAACKAPYAPVVESERVPTRPGLANKIWKHEDGDKIGQRSDDSPNLDPQRNISITRVTGYRPTCTCGVKETTRAVILDPFLGAGRTAQAAHWLGRDWIGCELNQEYADMVPLVIAEVPRFARVKKGKREKKAKAEKLLF